MKLIVSCMVIMLVIGLEVGCGGMPQDSACIPPRPKVELIEPQSIKVHSPSVLLTVRGSNFVPTSVVFFDGHATVTTYISSQQLRAIVPLEFLHRQGEVPVDVFNPLDANCNGLVVGQSQASNSVIFTIVP